MHENKGAKKLRSGRREEEAMMIESSDVRVLDVRHDLPRTPLPRLGVVGIDIRVDSDIELCTLADGQQHGTTERRRIPRSTPH